MSSKNKHQVKWNTYWKNRSIKRRIIEYIRRRYFAKIFVDGVCTDIIPRARILEAGCGSGTYLKLLDQRGHNVVGLDISSESLATAKKNCATLVRADIFRLPFKNKYFDVVFNQGVMEHFDDAKFVLALKEMARTGRKVVIIVPSDRSFFKIFDPFGDDPNKRFFSRLELKMMLETILNNVEVEYVVRSGLLSIMGRGVPSNG
jgi:SAM-dependent methyltransferase